MAWEVVIAAALALVGSLVGSVLANRRSTGLIAYRIEQLEKEVAEHNSMIDRMYCAESKIAVIERDVKANHARLKNLEERK